MAEDASHPGNALTVYAARLVDTVPGPAAQWLLNDLQVRLSL